jgi:hypothetical protein
VQELASTEPGAEWQLWVIGGKEPRVRRLQVTTEGLNIRAPSSTFSHRISMLLRAPTCLPSTGLRVPRSSSSSTKQLPTTKLNHEGESRA